MNIPKSLHTITAIVAVARATQQECIARGSFHWAALGAAEILGYPQDAADTHGLIARARKILEQGAAA